MKHWWLAVVVVSACATQAGGERPHRWPNHRKQGDARFEQLERVAKTLSEQNAELEARIRTLEDAVAKLKLRKPDGVASPEPPSTSVGTSPPPPAN